MAKADPFAQRRLLDLAAIDRSLAAARHRRDSLPELVVIAQGRARRDELNAAEVLAATDVGDLDRAARKLDTEIDQVRARAERDSARMTSGGAGSKELENLQHEIASLARRQGVLEDDALELMERRENADAALEGIRAELEQANARITAAEERRDQALAGLDDETGRLATSRQELAAGLPADLVTLYERIRATGKVAAATLRGGSCDACRMQIDQSELAQIRSAPVDHVVRCPECGAILLRT